MEASHSAFVDLGSREIVCESHGPFIAKGTQLPRGREVWTTCPDCESERAAAEKRAADEAAAQRSRDRWDAMLRASGIPERLKGCTFATYRATTSGQKKALDAARDYARDFRKHAKSGESLIFIGKPGNGKGHLAAAIMADLMPEWQPIYTTCLDMIRSVRDTWRKDSKFSETQVLQEYEDAALLIIDEIGAQYGTDGEQTIVFDVLDRRYRQMRPTILITNQDIPGLTQYIGERAYDRLKQTAANPIVFDWASYRPTARKEST